MAEENNVNKQPEMIEKLKSKGLTGYFVIIEESCNDKQVDVCLHKAADSDYYIILGCYFYLRACFISFAFKPALLFLLK